MRKVTVFYPAWASEIRQLLNEYAKQYIPDVKLQHCCDDSLLDAILAAGSITPTIERRTVDDFAAAANTGCEYVIDACSSIGKVATKYADAFQVPLLRIDGPMCKYAAEHFDRIGVIGTLATSVDPCADLIRFYAEKAGKKNVYIDAATAEGAMDAYQKGDLETGRKIIQEKAEKMFGTVDVFVLAQGSMFQHKPFIEEKSGLPVLTTPEMCIQNLKTLLEQNA